MAKFRKRFTKKRRTFRKRRQFRRKRTNAGYDGLYKARIMIREPITSNSAGTTGA